MTKRFDTRTVHGGKDGPAAAGGGVIPALEFSTTFRRDDPRDPQAHIYSRSANPNRALLERRLASLEDGHAALAFASGQAAAMALVQTLPPGSHILATEDAYFGVLLQFRSLAPQMGHAVTPVDTTSIDAVREHWRDNTRLLWLETPSNPQMIITDLAAMAALARERGAVSCCDNTVASSVWQRPLNHGCDFSMHSTTKYFGGHSDLTGGVLIAREPSATLDRLRHVQDVAGAIPAPFDCWLLLRSLATLGVRVRHQSLTAALLAERLAAHRAVERVLYPGDPEHPQRALIERQMTGGGALLSMLVRGDADFAIRVAKGTRIVQQATSLGGVESLIEHRHSVEGEHTRSPVNLLRLSVGVEDPDDLTEDLFAALAAAEH